jgi:hypothetical protein
VQCLEYFINFVIKEAIENYISWVKAVNAYSTHLKFAKSWPCYSAQEAVQLYSAFHFPAETKRMYQASRHLPDVQNACRSHMDSPVVSTEWL